MCDNDSIPWVEKYRPKQFNHIVMDPNNRLILKNIIETGYFPNILLYGPPGTGKTTTIINLIQGFQEKYDQKSKDLIIHLNASDERGIDIIRNQIKQFVRSKTLFKKGIKFVILDEVDYMTKNAQKALRSLLQSYSEDVRFCLICNYISKIENALQEEFLKFRFNKLPEKEITMFLKNIVEKEHVNMDDNQLLIIQQLYNSDMRSMINYIQSNQYNTDFNNVIDHGIWNKLSDTIINESSVNRIILYIEKISIDYSLQEKNIIIEYLNYIIQYNKIVLSPAFLSFVENLVHMKNLNNGENKTIRYVIPYFVVKMKAFLQKK